jgi:RNA polymerase sigma-70 factor (ECF subfamily)
VLISLVSVSQEVAHASRTGSRRLEAARLPEHTDRLYRAAYALSGSAADAEDLVQETFARVLSRPRFVRGGGERAYLMRVLRNTWIDFARARAARPEPTGGEAVDWVVEAESDRELPEHQREAIVAVDVLGLSYKEAARSLGILQGTLPALRGRPSWACARRRRRRPREAGSSRLCCTGPLRGSPSPPGRRSSAGAPRGHAATSSMAARPRQSSTDTPITELATR